MTLKFFLVAVAILAAVALVCWKKVKSFRAEIVQLVPWHDRWEIFSRELLIVGFKFMTGLFAAAVFALCVYGTVTWLAR
jgi:hypothetical protein